MGGRRFAVSYLLVGLAAVAVYRFEHSQYAYWAIALYGAAGTAFGAWKMPRAERRPWLIIAAGVVLWVGGDVEWYAETLFGRNPTSPGVSDVFYLVAYPLVAVGLIRLARGYVRTSAGVLVDSLVFGVTLVSALWPVLFATVMDGADQPLGARLTMGTYPCWDVLYVVLGARIVLGRRLHTQQTLLLLAGLAAYFLGDLFWFGAVQNYALGDWMDYARLSAYVAFGGAALLPAKQSVKQPGEVSSLRRFAVLALPVTVVPAMVVVETLIGRDFGFVDALLIFALVMLVLTRLWIVIRGLEAARAELREENRLKDELISVVSHDLRTPLTSIMGYLELVAEADDPETARAFLEVVRRNTGRLHRLVEDLLFVSRVQSGHETLALEPICMGELVSDTVAAALPAADAAGVELESVVETDDVVLADAHRLAEVLENLLSNAVKFTPPGGRVSVYAGHADDGQLLVCVTDTGVGIAAEDCTRLFDRFFRAQGAEGIPGAGLGLSIVKAIVDAHGGTVDVSSTVGAGTTFEVRLPLRSAEPAVIAA